MTIKEAIDKIVGAFSSVDGEYPEPKFPKKSYRNQALEALKALGCTDEELAPYPPDDDPADPDEPPKI